MGAVVLLEASGPLRPVAAVKSQVTVQFSIDAESYRRPLGDLDCTAACRTLTRSLADSVRGLLRHRYPFANWVTSGESRDTVEFHWVDDPESETQWSQLQFRIKSSEASVQLDQFNVGFEDFAEVSARLASSGWRPDSLRVAWLRKLNTKFTMPELLLRVFGRIPIGADVAFQPVGKVRLGVTAAELGAAQGEVPTFGVVARVNDQQFGTSELALVTLKGCLTLAGNVGLLCDPVRLAYPSKEVVGTELQALLTRATFIPQSVRVIEFVSQGNTTVGTLQHPQE